MENQFTKEQLKPEVFDMLSEDIGDLSALKTEDKSSAVNAVNEIVGKGIISSAIGFPLLPSDTFTMMGSKIDGITETFKDKLVENDVVVQDGLKIPDMIDLISDVAKGKRRMAAGEGRTVNMISSSVYSELEVKNLEFTPSIILVYAINLNKPDKFTVYAEFMDSTKSYCFGVSSSGVWSQPVSTTDNTSNWYVYDNAFRLYVNPTNGARDAKWIAFE